MVRASRRFYSACLSAMALCLTPSRVRQELERTAGAADSRVVKNDDGTASTFEVAFSIEKRERSEGDLLRGKLMSFVPKGFNPGQDVIVPLKRVNVQYVSKEDADELRFTVGKMSGLLLYPRDKGKPWVFFPFGLCAEREIEIFNKQLRKAGKSTSEVRPLENDIHRPGYRLMEFVPTASPDPAKKEWRIGDLDGKVVLLDKRSQPPALGKRYLFWYLELESVLIVILAGLPGSVDLNQRPTLLEMGFALDFEAALGLAKEFMDEESIAARAKELEEMVVEVGHPTYDYLLKIGLLTEDDDLPFKVRQVGDAITVACRQGKEEIRTTFHEAEGAFMALNLPRLEEILGSVPLLAFMEATAGEDALTVLIGATLEEDFSWEKPLHLHLRRLLLKRTVEAAAEETRAAIELAKTAAAAVVEEPSPAKGSKRSRGRGRKLPPAESPTASG